MVLRGLIKLTVTMVPVKLSKHHENERDIIPHKMCNLIQIFLFRHIL